MTRDEYARLKGIVAEALSRPDAERASYLTAECGSDSAARAEVESLLAAAVTAAPLYEEPTLLAAGGRLSADALDAASDITLPFFPKLRAPFDAPADEEFHGTDRYVVLRRIGAGGMGIVYAVADRARGQTVALKTLRRRSGDDIYQLKREFRNLADVAHPNLVPLYDLVVDDRQCFFTMELVEGLTFVEYARRASWERSTADRVREALPQLIHGVQELHRRGLQHRDIKPSNVLVRPDGQVVILDFGLTSALLREGDGGRTPVGTPAYLSPEQCAGDAPSDASDWYGVGATLYHALTGRVPFDGPIREVIARKTTEDPPPISTVAPGTPDDLAAICMGLLRRGAAERLTGQQAAARLLGVGPAPSEDAGRSAEVPFIGRESSLAALETAFASARTGRSVSVIIHGPSGIGKSALVQCFIDRRPHGASAFVLRSRCHEHESIPYNGLDGAIDGLARHLATLPARELANVLPHDMGALARLFPVLQVLGVEAATDADLPDPILLRRKAFTAFRELLGRIAPGHTLVLDIDDFHWADADSVRWLTDLLRPPAPASLLMLVSFRSEELEAKAFLRAFLERLDIGERVSLPVGPMSPSDVARMIESMLPGARSGSVAAAEIARDSGGNPFLIEALTRHAALGADVRGSVTLDEMLDRRLDALPAESRAFLDTLAVCGRPMLPGRIFEACGYTGDERPLVARLKSEHLLRSSRDAERVEMYHDRIREALAARLPADTARHTHDLMAQVLVAHGDDDPEALFEHYRGAGRPALAATQAAAAAARASAVLAFDLASSFYRQALGLRPDAAERTEWSAQLARALENAGRPVEAADMYLDAAGRTDGTDQLEWRRKAAELLLVGGQIDRGLEASGEVLDKVGMRLARGPRTAVASLAFRRLQLRWRGLDFEARDAASIPAEDLLQIDAAWAISAGLAMVDPIRAAAFNVRQLLRALDVGDPYRVARALALEAGFSVVGVGAGLKRIEMFTNRARTLPAHEGQQYVSALTLLWAGIAAFLTGQWKKATESCGRAVTTLQDECTGVLWELNMARNFFLGGLLSLGELRGVAGHLPGLLQTAEERGNFYLEIELRTRMILVWLAADDADGAARRADEAIARWSHRGFQRQHYNHLLTRVQTDLYRGRARDAWERMARHEAPIRQSLFLRVQHTRIESANYHARCALAMAGSGYDASRMRGIALRDASRIRREDMPWSNPFVRLIQGTVAHQEGDATAAIARLSAALEGFDAAGMRLYAAACRRRLGQILGGDAGRALVDEADRWLAAQEVRDADAMTRLIAPGFPD